MFTLLVLEVLGFELKVDSVGASYVWRDSVSFLHTLAKCLGLELVPKVGGGGSVYIERSYSLCVFSRECFGVVVSEIFLSWLIFARNMCVLVHLITKNISFP